MLVLFVTVTASLNRSYDMRHISRVEPIRSLTANRTLHAPVRSLLMGAKTSLPLVLERFALVLGRTVLLGARSSLVRLTMTIPIP